MQRTELREKYISLLMEKGLSRKDAEETVDIKDNNGNIAGLISEDALHLEISLRDMFRMEDVRQNMAKHILESFPSIPDKVRQILKEDTKES